MRLADALIQALRDYGAHEIFGIPGDFALPFFKVIEQSNILPLYTLSHEPGVGFAADATARYRTGLGVAAVTYGAGALNMVNAVATAYAEKSPLVVVSGAPGVEERRLGFGLHHQVKNLDSQRLVFNEVTCAQTVLDDPAKASSEIARVLSEARRRSLPVYIELPRDQVGVEVDPVPVLDQPTSNPEAVAACAREIMDRLRQAKNPTILLGVEVRRFGLEPAVEALVSTLDIPAVTSFMGRGLLAGSATPPVGTYIGLAGEDGIRHLVEDSDCLLMLGVILCDTNFGTSARQIDQRHAIHAFDGAVRFAHHTFPDVSLSDLLTALGREAERLTPAARTYAPPAPPTGLAHDDQQILPSDIACAVNDAFAKHGRLPIASDMGDCLFTAMDMVHTELAAPGYYATMGSGVPMGLALSAVDDRRSLILVGDGAFQMTGWELGNCRRYGWAPIVLVFNNRAWGMLKNFQGDTSYNDLSDWDFAHLAKGLGGRGHRVRTRAELADAIEAAIADNSCFQLIDVIIPPGAYSNTLSRFAETIKKRSALRSG